MMPHLSPQRFKGYAHLNLRFNPFGRLTQEEEALVALPAIDVEPLVERLRRPRTASQFLAPSGRGKTTHLMALRRHFPGSPYIYVGRGQPAPPVPEAPILFVDEMQRVPGRQRAALLARGCSYVVGSHANHSREFSNAGLAYEVIRLDSVSAARLNAILNRRITFARRHPRQPLPIFTEAGAVMLLARCGADLWAMNEILYDIFEALHDVNALDRTLAAYLDTYRLPWRRRLLQLETPVNAALLDLIVH